MNTIVQLKAPTHVELTITEKCNHRCGHCYNVWRNNENQARTMSLEQAEYIINQLVENQVSYVTITGGEPLMACEVFFFILRRLRENNIGVGLNTNLSLMTDSIARILVSDFEWCNTILTSLPAFNNEECDAVTKVKGSFDNIMRGIDICLRNNIPVGVNVVVTKTSVDKLEQLNEFLEKHKISTLALTRVVPPPHNITEDNFILNEKDIRKIASFLNKVVDRFGIKATSLCSLPFCLLEDPRDSVHLSTKCAAGIIGCCINGVTGEVTPCAHNEISYGNIFELPLTKIWLSMSQWRSMDFVPSECRHCAMLSQCGGDCRLNSFRFKKLPYQLDGSCRFTVNHSYGMEKQYDKKAIYAFNNKTLMREEVFGAVVSLGINEFYVSKSVYAFLCELRHRECFGFCELNAICEFNDDVVQLLDKLICAEIIYLYDFKSDYT